MKRITVKAIALALGMCAAAGLSAGVQAGGTSYVANWIDTAFKNDILFGSSVNEKKADQTLKAPSESSQEAREFTFNQPTTTNYFDYKPKTKTYKNNSFNNLFHTDTNQQITNTSQFWNDNKSIINNMKPQTGSLFGKYDTPIFDNQKSSNTSQLLNDNNIDNNKTKDEQISTSNFSFKQEIQDIKDINNKLSGHINGLYGKVNAINNVLENGTLITNITNQIENFSKELNDFKATTLNFEKRLNSLEDKKTLANNEAFKDVDLKKAIQEQVTEQLRSQMAGNVETIRNEVSKVLNDSAWAKDITTKISTLFTELTKVTKTVDALSKALSEKQQKEINKVPLFEEHIKPKNQPIKSQNKADLKYLAQVMTNGINQKKGK